MFCFYVSKGNSILLHRHSLENNFNFRDERNFCLQNFHNKFVDPKMLIIPLSL